MESGPEVSGPLNLGNPNEFSMLKLAEKVLEYTDSNSELVFLPLPQDDPTQRQPDISQAKLLLDWTPSIQLEEGLKRSIRYFQSELL